MKNLTEMNKAELRAECKEHGVKNYSKMNNQGMRDAILEALNPTPNLDDADDAEAQAAYEQRKADRAAARDELAAKAAPEAEVDFDEPQQREVTYNESGDPVLAEDMIYIKQYGFAYCPGCERHLSNGVSVHGMDVNGKPLRHKTNEYACMACGEEFGESIKVGTATAAPAGTGVKIEKDRPEQNGVKRPSAGGVCREVWDWCDEFRSEHKRSPLPKEAKLVAASKGWNMNNVTCEIYQWRKFNGIRGRVAVAATETK